MIKLKNTVKAFSLVEVMVVMAILLIAGLGTISAIIFTRQSMELDKQRLAALNYCRQALESAEANASVSAGEQLLTPFNMPGVENLLSTLKYTYYNIKNNAPHTGEIEWETPLTAAPDNTPVLCHVTVTWRPPGAWSGREHKISMMGIVMAGMH
jgi:prepilin-type N-terminal cleavage/methylation domain-containing protein